MRANQKPFLVAESKWAWWLHHARHLRVTMLQSQGQNRKWPANDGYKTPAVRGVTNASQLGTKSEKAHQWAWWLHHPCRLGVPNVSKWKQS